MRRLPAESQKGLEEAGGSPATYGDFRRLLDNKDVDVVINATPDHWHALPAIMACQAGKDVFVEKPVCVAVEEGKKMVEAARKYKRVVQVGLWQRSNLHFQRAAQIVQQGLLGKITFVRTWNYGNSYPEGIGNPADSEPPAGLDWDMWLGPAPKVPFNWNRFGVGDRWSTFRYFYDYANGWLGDWCIHLLDIVQWAMKVDGPTAISSSGSKFYLRGQQRNPRHAAGHVRIPGLHLHLREPAAQREFDVRQGLRHRVSRFRRDDVPRPVRLSGLPGKEDRAEERGGPDGDDADGSGGRRPVQPRRKPDRVHEEPRHAR